MISSKIFRDISYHGAIDYPGAFLNIGTSISFLYLYSKKDKFGYYFLIFIFALEFIGSVGLICFALTEAAINESGFTKLFSSQALIGTIYFEIIEFLISVTALILLIKNSSDQIKHFMRSLLAGFAK
jgi:hypothetical protein